jgi:hypothetical protein
MEGQPLVSLCATDGNDVVRGVGMWLDRQGTLEHPCGVAAGRILGDKHLELLNGHLYTVRL